jgi:hypothetical protein
MALTLTSENELAANIGAPVRRDPLAIAYSVLFAVLIAIGLLVTFFGGSTGDATVLRIDLTKTAASAPPEKLQ